MVGGSGVRAGETVMMAPISGLSLHLVRKESIPKLQNANHLNVAIANLIQSCAEKSEVAVALDSVIFKDNTVIGPDLAGKLDELNSERRILRQLATELLNQPSSERSAYLMAISKDPEAHNALATEPRGQRQRLADMLLGTITVTGSDGDFFRSTTDDILNRKTLELRRRNP